MIKLVFNQLLRRGVRLKAKYDSFLITTTTICDLNICNMIVCFSVFKDKNIPLLCNVTNRVVKLI